MNFINQFKYKIADKSAPGNGYGYPEQLDQNLVIDTFFTDNANATKPFISEDSRYLQQSPAEFALTTMHGNTSRASSINRCCLIRWIAVETGDTRNNTD